MTRTPDGRPTTAFPADLAAVAALALANLALALARADPWRILLGWPLPLLLPGYALVAWLFPARASRPPLHRSLGAWERIGLGVVLSVACTGVLGILLNFVPGGITLATMAFALGLATLLFLVLATDARLRVPVEDRPHFTLGLAPNPERPAGRTSPAMAGLLAISFAGMLLVLVLLFPYTPSVDAYTNLYVLGDGGMAACLPDTYTPPGEPGAGFSAHPAGFAPCPAPTGHILLGIVNHEAKVATYHVRVFWSAPTPEPRDAPTAGPIASFAIQLGPIGPPGAKLTFERQYEREITLTPPPLAGLQRVNVQVYKDFGDGVQATPDLYTYFYVTAPSA
jgi:uncharacterized membrane protein